MNEMSPELVSRIHILPVFACRKTLSMLEKIEMKVIGEMEQ